MRSRLLPLTGALAALATGWFLATLVAGPLGPVAAGWFLTPVVVGLSALVAWRTGRDPHVAAAARRFWRRMGVALGVLAASTLVMAVESANADLSATFRMGFADGLLRAVATLLMIWPMIALPWGAGSRAGRLTVGLDVAILSSAALVFFWYLTEQPLVGTARTDSTRAGAALAVSGVLAVVAIAKMAVTAANSLDRRSLRSLRTALLVGFAGATLTPFLAERTYLDTSLLVYPVGAFLIAVAARQQAGARAAAEPGRSYPVLPYLGAAATNVLLIVLLVRGDGAALPVALAAMVLTGLVVVRQLTALRENGRLLGRLDANILELRRTEQRFRLLVQNSSDVVTCTALDGSILYVSPAVERVLGREPAPLLGVTLQELVHPEDQPILREATSRVLAGPGVSVTYRIRLTHADGSDRMLEITSANLLHEPGLDGIVSNARDVTETVEAHERLSYEATHDMLTGLANRALFGARVETCVARTQPGERISIVLVDLDDFKSVNDTLGHSVGDSLLVAVADRMRATVRPGDTVARLGGDEFAILFEGLTDEAVERVLERIADTLAVPVDVEGHLLTVRASFGVVDGRGGDDPGNLMRQADIAMYEAKERGDGGFQRYRPGSEARGAERHRITSALTGALDRQEFLLHYQPVVTLPEGRITGVEALVRWMHPKRGLLGPGEFIPGAELTGMIVPLGAWVLREACRQAAAWVAELGADAPGTMSVNVSARQLRAAGLADEVAAALRDSGLAPHRLTIEITESTAVGGGATHETLRALREMGVRLSLDDFGTGASTLSLLANCPVDQIKLDRSFAPVPGPDAIAGAVLQLARAMGVEAIAEGVETAEQAEKLGDLGYVRAQGFLFARPMAAELISAAIAERVAPPVTVAAGRPSARL